MRIKRTFSFNDETIRLLQLVCAARNISNTSELLRDLITREAVRLNIISYPTMKVEDMPDIETYKTGLMMAEFLKLNNKVDNIDQKCNKLLETKKGSNARSIKVKKKENRK